MKYEGSITYKKLMKCTKITYLGNLGIFLYQVKFGRENQRK